MNTEERRALILKTLGASPESVTGHELSEQLGVSRQVIVQDIAVLRAHGTQILATPRGYIISAGPKPREHQAVVACRHDHANVTEELMIVVRNGGEVYDVTVEHPVYGQITGMLMLKTENDVRDFMKKVDNTGASLLSSLTRGVHLHTVRAKDSRSLGKILAELGAKGFLVTDED